ncbi:MAG: OmpA family protein [Thermonemataceae bacterium]|nr:OmpA family protein [Thermonemataceae bacterium]
MRFTIFFYYLFILPLTLSAQNLIPNGGFEEYGRCPKELGSVRIGNLKYWQANPPDCTPDFFHECSQEFGKQNPCGNLKAQEGKGYLGLIVRVGASPEQNTDELFYREHIQTKLLSPLKARNRYIFRMYVSLSEFSYYAMSKIGVLFSQNPVLVGDKHNFSPQIESSFIDIQKNWVLITDTIIADGNEQYITIGDFSSFSKKDIRKIAENKNYEKYFSCFRAYYFFDNLSLTWLDALPEPILANAPMPPFKAEAPTFTGWEKPWQLEPTEFGYLKPNEPIILKNVLFEFGKATLLDKSKVELDKLFRLLKEYQELKIVISGHTDEIGSAEKNIKLSEQRAKAVYEYLITKGILADRLFFGGYGSTKPIESNQSEVGRKKNRRVEFFILEQE